ncbi:MAG: SDR family NAD(P)-dependent oxidoreductase [Chloroflexi bacterium]|nr:SDR family NAD(P)-dependent oxidoreductase [Chloroflexota bacterium]
MRLAGKIVIVTGSSRGIGKAIALAMAQEGAQVVVAARTEQESAGPLPGTIYNVAEEIHALGGHALPIKVDVTDEDQVTAMVRRILEEWGRIHVLVNNAGILIQGRVVDVPLRRWDLVMRVNLRGTFLCTKAVLPHMMERREGSIINISSWVGRQASPGSVAYSVSKAGIEMFTAGLAEEVREYDIAVNCLSPYRIVDTEGARYLHPGADRSRWEPPELMAEAAVFLATRTAATLTGKSIVSQEWKALQAGIAH